MTSVESYVRSRQDRLRELWMNPTLRILTKLTGAAALGFILSAASLKQQAMPLAMAGIFACSRTMAAAMGAGGLLGYLLLWGSTGIQPSVWLAAALITALLMDGKRQGRETPLLMPACACLIVSACGVVFQNFFQEAAPVGIYLLRVALAGGCTWLFQKTENSGNPVFRWLASGFLVLGFAQLAPLPWLGLGYLAAAALTMARSFPAAAISGLALDLSQITLVPMGAVMAVSYLVRLIPHMPRWSLQTVPAAAYLVVMGLCGKWNPAPVPALLAGGILGTYLPGPGKAVRKRGETGAAQVRLEIAAGALQEMQQMLLEVREIPVDEDALVTRAAEQACSGCPCRKTCREREKIATLSGHLLHSPLLSPQDLPFACRKSGRFLAELHHSQERARAIRAGRQTQKEYREALCQQYRFLGEFLQDLSDQLSVRSGSCQPCFTPEIHVYGNRPEGDNGDRCAHFSGIMGKYYVLLCDGMGTGMGAVQEGKAAVSILKRMLTAGFPAEYALRSMNSLCMLRNRPGAATADLAELDLRTGKTTLYKWGAAPSYIINGSGTEKIGTAGPPPGLSLTDIQEKRSQLSLRRGQTLVMTSDGVDAEGALQWMEDNRSLSAEYLLPVGGKGEEDDATVITVRLKPALPS